MLLIVLVAALLALASAGHNGASPGPVASTPENGYCETFRRVWNAYPSGEYPSAQLVEDLRLTWLNPSGGTANTCTIRMSLGLLGIGVDVGRESRGIASLVTNANVAGLNPPVSSGSSWTSLVSVLPNIRSLRQQPILVRVRDLFPYITRRLGAPTWTGGKGTLIGTRQENGQRIEEWQDDRRIWGKAGLIMYTDCGWTDATGHWDVYNGREHRNHGFPDVCKSIKMWNVCGSAFDRGQSGGGANTPSTTRAPTTGGSVPLPPPRPGSSSGSGSSVLCAKTSARIRAGPTTSSATVRIVTAGRRITTTRLSNSWYTVSDPEAGFMAASVLGPC